MLTKSDYLPMAMAVKKVYGFPWLDRDEFESAAGLAYANAVNLFDSTSGKSWPAYLFKAMKNQLFYDAYAKRNFGFRFRHGGKPVTKVDRLDRLSMSMPKPQEEASSPSESQGGKHGESLEPIHCDDPDTMIDAQIITEMITNRLGERDASVFLAYVMEDLKMEEVATRFGISRQRVGQIISKSKERIKCIQIKLQGELNESKGYV